MAEKLRAALVLANVPDYDGASMSSDQTFLGSLTDGQCGHSCLQSVECFNWLRILEIEKAC